MYSTSDLATYFQVSRLTIDKWIEQGRFINVSRTYDLPFSIDENVEWQDAKGSRVTIKKIVENYKNDPTNPPGLSLEEEKEEISFEIKKLEEKYGGNLEHILTGKPLSSEEEKDLGTWIHFSRMAKQYE